MSKGPGKIQRAIETIFADRPNSALNVEELAAIVFEGVNRIDKKHRVSVLRAASSACDRSDWSYLKAEALGGMLIYFNQRNTPSYVLAKARARFPEESAEALSMQLEGGNSQNRFIEFLRQKSRPGQSFDLHVRLFCAQLDGDENGMLLARQQIDAKALDETTAGKSTTI